jgi:hypothetical protein
MAEVLARLDSWCRAQGDQGPKCPSRATLYKTIRTLPVRKYRVSGLPPAVRDALYNLEAESDVPGHQVAFYCFNYGNLEAMSFASGLPWLALHQALLLPGHRARSRGLLESVTRARGL